MNTGSLSAEIFLILYLFTGANIGVAIFISVPKIPQPIENTANTERTGMSAFNILPSPIIYCMDIIHIIYFKNITNSVYNVIFFFFFSEHRY